MHTFGRYVSGSIVHFAYTTTLFFCHPSILCVILVMCCSITLIHRFLRHSDLYWFLGLSVTFLFWVPCTHQIGARCVISAVRTLFFISPASPIHRIHRLLADGTSRPWLRFVGSSVCTHWQAEAPTLTRKALNKMVFTSRPQRASGNYREFHRAPCLAVGCRASSSLPLAMRKASCTTIAGLSIF
jgi:hypothetical protein